MKHHLNFLWSRVFPFTFSVLFYALFFVVQMSVAVPQALAADLTSPSFIVRDPMIGTGAGYYASGSFRLFGSGNTALSGNNASATYKGEYGFLYWPFIQSGVLSVSVVNSTANLTWTASTAGSGFSVSGYKIGISSASSGPYVFTSVGNVTNYSYANLSLGTYYFVLQTLDGLGAVAATSNEVSATIVATTPPTSGGGHGGNMPNPDYIPGVPHSCARIADFNCDGYVDILDLSILLYYTDKSGDIIKPFDLKRDGKIDLQDISIVFYYWDFNLRQEQR